MAAAIPGKTRFGAGCARAGGAMVRQCGMAVIAAMAAVFWAGAARAEASRQTMDEDWITAPMLSQPAPTMPRGAYAVGASAWDVISSTEAGAGAKRADQHSYNLMPFAVYGVRDDLNIGFFPILGTDQMPDGGSGAQLGDWTLEGQYRLTEFREGGWLPTIALNLAEAFPTGRFDRLARAGDGLGTGAFITTMGLYTQTWFWMPTGRVLRANLNISYAVSSGAGIKGMSVYGTQDGFGGRVERGPSLFADAALGYSVAPRWALAVEFFAQQDDNTRVTGRDVSGAPFSSDSGTGEVLYIAPSVQYNWGSGNGLMAGVRFYAAGRNETPSVMPMLTFISYAGPEA